MDCKSREERALRLVRAVKLVLAGDVNAVARAGRSQKSEARCQKSEVSGRARITEAIRKVLEGDIEAYGEIYAVCDGALRAFTRRRYGHLGGDFVDEVAIRTHEYAFSHLNRYDSDKGASFQTWLLWQSRSIAGHVAREWFSRRFVRYSPAAHEPWTVTDTGPADVHEERRLCRVLREETLALPVDERHAVMLHDKGGMTFAESAEAAGVTPMKFRYLRLRALTRLKQRMQERGVSPVPVDSTPVPIWHGRDSTDHDDDFTASVTAVLPEPPDTLVGAAAAREEEEAGKR